MLSHLATILLLAVCAQGQSTAPSAPTTDTPNAEAHRPAVANDDLFPAHKISGKVSLVRGVLKQVDPIHDQLVVQTFGGGSLRIGFDGRTALSPESAAAHLTGIRPGSVVSVDTALQDGKLFARAVRVGATSAAELNGQIVGFDAARSRLTLRDPISPENVSLRITPQTTLTHGEKPATAQDLRPGALVKVSFSASDKTASEVEILAEKGGSFTFQGRILAVDLRARTLSLSNDTDQSVRELAFNSLDDQSREQLRDGNNVTIEAEFDGDRYNIRNVTPATAKP